eukprot:m.4848 g.4848  ORF g.4848 m.4848 type:complete len:259 (-) comp4401_c0_seq1:29-805(-)
MAAPAAATADILSVVQQLETLFLKAECDLDYGTRKLDIEFEDIFAPNGNDHLNPLKLLTRITRLKSELARIDALTREVQREKESFLSHTVPLLLANSKAVEGLATRAALAPCQPGDQQFLEEVAVTHAGPRGGKENEENDPNATFNIDEPAAPPPAPPAAAAKAPGRTRTSFVQVSPKEFESVSALVRGRVKLPEVNQAFEAIFNAFKKDKKRETLSVKELTALGIVVTGATGEAKLKVLRALKLIAIGRDGSMQLTF